MGGTLNRPLGEFESNLLGVEGPDGEYRAGEEDPKGVEAGLVFNTGLSKPAEGLVNTVALDGVLKSPPSGRDGDGGG